MPSAAGAGDPEPDSGLSDSKALALSDGVTGCL